MKKRFLDWLICKLGGATLDECAESNRNSYQMGIYIAHLKMKTYADSMYGITPDEWCRRMYDLITTKIQALEQSAEIMASNQKKARLTQTGSKTIVKKHRTIIMDWYDRFES